MTPGLIIWLVAFVLIVSVLVAVVLTCIAFAVVGAVFGIAWLVLKIIPSNENQIRNDC